MTGRCGVPDCHAVAELAVAEPEGTELDVCREHWSDALDRTDGRIRGVRLIHRPRCFLTGCDAAATAVLEDRAGLPRPVCQPHWDDLSWIECPPDRVLVSSPLRRPGPSRPSGRRWSRD